MALEIRPFVEHQGQRFPLQVTLPGRGDADDLLRTVEKIVLDGEAFAQLSTLYLALHVTATIRQPCRRCLTPVTQTVELDEEFEVPIPPGVEEVDLWPDVVRLVLSAHDPNVVCREDCRGLCPFCGADLNRERDHHCDLQEEETLPLRDYLSWPDES